MKLLILSWRDIKHPQTGGAGVVIHELSKRWVKWGHEVTVFTSRFPGSSPRENVDGVNIIRSGNPISLYLHANRYYKKQFRDKFDVVIEELFGPIPWYSYYYINEPLIGLIHNFGRSFNKFELKKSIHYYEIPHGLNFFTYMAEAYLMKYFNKIPTMVMSESTRKDIIELGHPKETVYLVPEATKVKPINKLGKKENRPTFTYFGRVKRWKRVHHVLRAFEYVKREYPEVQLWVIGTGPKNYENELKRLAKSLEIKNNVRFFGYVEDCKKNELLQRSHAIIMASIREGWGLVVTEANAMGTPAIGYNVPGLCDSIVDGKTGILVEPNNISALGDAMIKIIQDEKLRDELTLNAWKWSRKLSWERSAKVAMSHINDILSKHHSKV